MKFNWPNTLILFFVIFVTTLAYLLYKSKQYDHSLVADNYYDYDITYQEMFDKKSRSRSISPVPYVHKLDTSGWVISISPQSLPNAHGEILFYNPASKSKDFKLKCTEGDTILKVPQDKITPGRWKIQYNIDSKGSSYYFEEEIFVD